MKSGLEDEKHLPISKHDRGLSGRACGVGKPSGLQILVLWRARPCFDKGKKRGLHLQRLRVFVR
jgi:hypothetical protein